MRPVVSTRNMNKVLEITNTASSYGFDSALTRLIENYEKLQGDKSQ